MCTPAMRNALRRAADVRIAPADIDEPAGTLSDGNQQEVVPGQAPASTPDVPREELFAHVSA
ncbi:hypothetical protein GCM10009539_61820 [Cryptosporangium japonicum]|uniref:Uncharacterized protein n=2 Tax=Cryptosporangium japonicum TaxID=80872 RepID=A0ABP3EK37_9ACTN